MIEQKIQIEKLSHLADVLYSDTKTKHDATRSMLKAWQGLLDEMQDILDDLANDVQQEYINDQIDRAICKAEADTYTDLCKEYGDINSNIFMI